MTRRRRPDTLLLLTGAFGAAGGLEMYNRLIIKSVGELCAAESARTHVLVLNDVAAEVDSRYLAHPRTTVETFTRSKPAFVARALALSARLRPALVIVGHVGLGPLALAVRAVSPSSTLWYLTFGIEVWSRLPALKRFALSRANRILSISEYTAAQLVAVQRSVRAKIDIVPCAIDPFWGGDRGPSLAPGDAPGGPRLLTVARLAANERYKGVDHVLAALRELAEELPGLHYDVVGDGDDRARLQALAKELGVAHRVTFHGRVSAAELVEAYRRCTFFIMPSGSEGFGIVYLEAARFRKPSVAAASAGAPEVVIDGRTGRLVEYGDVGAIARVIRELAADPLRTAELGANARAQLEEFTYEKLHARVRSCFLRLSPRQGAPAVGARG